ncbi:MAG: hypothetical protein QXO20_06280 [Candidatus Bathyarchaeia archaeon]
MSWKFLVELECQKELAKLDSWDRGRAKNSTFVAPRVSPPKELVIQGLLPAPPSKPAPKREKCRECFHYDRRNSQCQIKRRMGLVMKGYCPKRFSRYSFSVNLNRPVKRSGDLCAFCDFYDKAKHNCLIKRVNGEGCIYIGKGAKAALPNLRTVIIKR